SQVTILCPLSPHNNRSLKEELAVLLQKGFTRVIVDDKLAKIEDILAELPASKNKSGADFDVKIVVDRLSVASDDETLGRMADSVQTAFFEGRGDCLVEENGKVH